jgi:hypothetical protein
MSLLWGLLDRIVPGPFGMLLFHNLLFWAGLGILAQPGLPRCQSCRSPISGTGGARSR